MFPGQIREAHPQDGLPTARLHGMGEASKKPHALSRQKLPGKESAERL